MSGYLPLFPTSSPPRPPERSLPSSVSSTSYRARPAEGYLESLSKAHARLSELPNDLSPEITPLSEDNVNIIRQALLETLSHANYNPSHAKWTHVRHLLRMPSTSRRYASVAFTPESGEKESVCGNYEFVLPETEEEWTACERRWERRTHGATGGEGRTSRFFARDALTVGGQAGEPSSRTEQLRDKVKQWQASVVPGTQESVPDSDDLPVAARALKGKEAENSQGQRQSPLPFPVMKHTVPASNAKMVSGTPHAGMPTALARNASKSSRNGAHSSTPAEEGIRIGDISEMSYLPPSFPAHLPTSTPRAREQNVKQREKPPPIHRLIPSPSSSPHLPKSQLERIEAPPATQLSHPDIAVSNTSAKRPITPPPEVVSNPSRSRSPPLKKPRGEHHVDRKSAAQSRPTTSPSPSAALPKGSPASTPGPTGLGNAKGLPVPVSSPVTPYRPTVPTLTELLASSRRSKPRPRPPSRKSKSRATTPALSAAGRDELPVFGEVHRARQTSPALTAPRTMLSSPASGSSSSSRASTPHRPRSPVSPLFTQNASAFAPPLTSTQPGGVVGDAAPGETLDRRSSGAVGLGGYNSQFDVEGQVGMVSDFLDKDVHFDEWIRDVTEVEADNT